MRVFVFVLLISILAGPAGWSREPDLVDDQTFLRSATHSLRQWLVEPDRVPAAQLNEQLVSRTHHAFELPPSQPAEPKGSSGAGIFNARGQLASVATSTRSIYYSRQDGIDRNLQMVLKTTIPASAILSLIRDQAPEPAVEAEPVSTEEVEPCLSPLSPTRGDRR